MSITDSRDPESKPASSLGDLNDRIVEKPTTQEPGKPEVPVASDIELLQAEALAYNLIGDITYLDDVFTVLTGKPVLAVPFFRTYAMLLTTVLNDDVSQGRIDGLLDRGHWLRHEGGPNERYCEMLGEAFQQYGLVRPAVTATQVEALMCAGAFARESSGYIPRSEDWFKPYRRSAVERARHPEHNELRRGRGVVQDSDRVDEGRSNTSAGRGNPSTSLSQLDGRLGRLAEARSEDDLEPGNE